MKVSKNGNGAFSVEVREDGTVHTTIEGGNPQSFKTVRDAYDYHREGLSALTGSVRGHAHFNICYHLEDAIDLA